MALYSISGDICLGISHSGAVNAETKGMVELSDGEVQQLVELIRSEGTTDVEELELEDVMPEVFEKLDEAYHDAAVHAETLHWLWEGYDNGYYEYDTGELIKHCKENCGFVFEYDKKDYLDEDGDLDEEALKDDEEEAFDEWLDHYLKGLSDDDAMSFFYCEMNADLNIMDVEYTVKIPEAIIKLAEE